MADSRSPSRLRILLIGAGAALGAQAIFLFAVLALGRGATAPALRPVTFEANILLQVDIRVGAVVVLALLAVSFLLLATQPLGERSARGLALHRHDVRWIIFSLTSSITTFLVAQLNGITAIGTLVLIYAATSTMTLFSVVQERMSPPLQGSSPSPVPRSTLALAFGAAIGIVPWGIIAFQEIASGIAGDGPSLTVRILTIAMLAFACAFAVTNWREQRHRLDGVRGQRGEHTFIVLSTVAASVFAWALFLSTF